MLEMTQSDCIPYEIIFRGRVDQRWAIWFEGYDLIRLENGNTLLRGYIRDQSELRGVLEKIANLNLQLISVNPVDKKESDRP